MVPIADQAFHVYETYHHGYKAEQGQEDLAKVATELQSVGHAFVLDKMNMEPVGKYGVLLGKEHVRFDPEFQCLVYQQYQYYNYNYVTIFQNL